jgi:hypothetical protein
MYQAETQARQHSRRKKLATVQRKKLQATTVTEAQTARSTV